MWKRLTWKGKRAKIRKSMTFDLFSFSGMATIAFIAVMLGLNSFVKTTANSKEGVETHLDITNIKPTYIWRFRISEVIYITLNLAYVLVQILLIFLLSQQTDRTDVGANWVGLVLIFPLFYMLAVQGFFILMVIAQFIIALARKDKSEIQNSIEFLACLVLAPLAIIIISYLIDSFLSQRSNTALAIFSLFFTFQTSVAALVITTFFRKKRIE